MPNEQELDAIAAELVGEAPEAAAPKAAEESPPASPPDPQEATAEPADTVEEPADESEAAAEKQLSATEFYSQQVPGTEMSYGDFKDRAKDLARADKLRRTQENEYLKFTQQMTLLQQNGLLPDVPEHIVEAIQVQRDQAQELAREQTLAVIPDWQDPDVKHKDIKEIASTFVPYGKDPGAVTQLIMADSGFAKYLYDRLQDDRALQRARDKVQAATRKQQAPSRGRSKPDQKTRFEQLANDSSLSSEDRKLAALLGGFS